LTRTLQTTSKDNKEQFNSNSSPTPKPKKMRDVYIKIHNANDTIHTDQPGQFPATSSSGNQYIMVLVEVDGNYIDVELM
jgi:hypothetical protein